MKIACGFLLLLLGSVLPAPVPEAKESNEHLMYPYGTAVGDMKNPKDDDGTSPKINIAKTFTFYGIPFRSLYVNNNGVISFAVPVPEYTPKAIPLMNGKHIVAPYWGDVNNILGGEVYYREETSPEILERLTKDINEYFPEISFTATWAFIATWDHVAYFGSISKKANTFQAILITDEQTSFIMFNYGEIQWTTGAASGGNRMTGLGGIPAQSGFDSGDDKNYFSIPGSRTPQIINITKTSNVHVPGRYVFQVDEFKVTGIPEELLHPAKEEATGNEEQGQQSNEPNEVEPAPIGNPPEEEESHVVQGNEVNSEVHGQEQNEETEPVPSGNVHEEEESQASQESEVHPDVEGQEKEEMEPVPSGNLPEEEESQVTQDNEVNPVAEEQEEKEEMEPVPSGNLEEKEESQVSQDNEVNPVAEEQEEKEEVELIPSGNLEEKEESQVSQDNEVNPVAEEQEEKEEVELIPSGNLEEKEESQVDQGYGNPEEEGQQKEGEDGGVSAGDLPDHPVQEPQLNDNSKESEESEESEECEW